MELVICNGAFVFLCVCVFPEQSPASLDSVSILLCRALLSPQATPDSAPSLRDAPSLHCSILPPILSSSYSSSSALSLSPPPFLPLSSHFALLSHSVLRIWSRTALVLPPIPFNNNDHNNKLDFYSSFLSMQPLYKEQRTNKGKKDVGRVERV